MADTHENETDNGAPEIEKILTEANAGQPQLPPGFRASVMRRIEAIQGSVSVWRRWRRAWRATNISYSAPAAVTGRAGVSKRILWGVAGVGAAAAVAVFFLGIPPIGDGTAGTIGAAKRFQGAAMSEKDVKTGPMAVQKFIQSESFDRILKNATLRNIMIKVSKDPELQKAFTDPAVIEALAEPSFIEMMREPSFQEALRGGVWSAVLRDPSFRQALTDSEFEKSLKAK